MANYVLILPMWGNEYINTFFSYTFKSIIQKGNLDYLNKNHNTKIIICTKQSDKKNILLNFKKNNFSINCEFCIIDSVIKKYNSKKILHQIYLKGFLKETRDHTKINFLLLTVDDFFSENNLSFISRLVAKKKEIRCILENKLIVNKKKFQSILKNYKNNQRITNGFLAKIAFQALDNFSKFSNPFFRKFNYSTYHLLYKVDNNCYLMRGFLLHPFLIRPRRQITKLNSFFDYYLVPEYTNSFKDLYIIKNSKNFLRVGISNRDVTNQIIYKFDIDKFSKVLKRWITPHHLKYAYNETIFTSKKKPNKIKLNKVKILSYSHIEIISNKIKDNLQSHHQHPAWNDSKNYLHQRINQLIKIKLIYPILRLINSAKF